MRSCDVGLFPNRAEGGTNLVAMEAIACGMPIILSNNTGHMDLTANFPCYKLEVQKNVNPISPMDGTEGWGESSIDEIISKLEKIYQNYHAAKQLGSDAAESIKEWNWHNRINALVEDI